MGRVCGQSRNTLPLPPPSPTPTHHHLPDYYTLRRFLRARTYNLQLATEMWVNHIQWCRDLDIDNLLQVELPGRGGEGRGGELMPPPNKVGAGGWGLGAEAGAVPQRRMGLRRG